MNIGFYIGFLALCFASSAATAWAIYRERRNHRD
jgi:hypothetical protein